MATDQSRFRVGCVGDMGRFDEYAAGKPWGCYHGSGCASAEEFGFEGRAADEGRCNGAGGNSGSASLDCHPSFGCRWRVVAYFAGGLADRIRTSGSGERGAVAGQNYVISALGAATA